MTSALPYNTGMALCLDRRDPALALPVPNGRRADDQDRPDTVPTLRLVYDADAALRDQLTGRGVPAPANR